MMIEEIDSDGSGTVDFDGMYNSRVFYLFHTNFWMDPKVLLCIHTDLSQIMETFI